MRLLLFFHAFVLAAASVAMGCSSGQTDMARSSALAVSSVTTTLMLKTWDECLAEGPYPAQPTLPSTAADTQACNGGSGQLWSFEPEAS